MIESTSIEFRFLGVFKAGHGAYLWSQGVTMSADNAVSTLEVNRTQLGDSLTNVGTVLNVTNPFRKHFQDLSLLNIRVCADSITSHGP